MSKENEGSKCADSPWQDLVIAILAVNQYSLEKTYPLVASLDKTGLFDPTVLRNLDCAQIEDCLRKGGCDRGSFMTALFSRRLAALGDFIRRQGLAARDQALVSGDPGTIEAFLIGVYGIGPKVIGNYLFLRGLKSRP